MNFRNSASSARKDYLENTPPSLEVCNKNDIANLQNQIDDLHKRLMALEGSASIFDITKDQFRTVVSSLCGVKKANTQSGQWKKQN